MSEAEEGADQRIATASGSTLQRVLWLSLRLIASLPTQVLALGVGPYKCAPLPPRWWTWFAAGGSIWLIFWSLILPRIQDRRRLRRVPILASALALVLFLAHASRTPSVPAETLGYVIAFLAMNAAAILAVRFGRTHLRVGLLYLVLSVGFFMLEVEAFSHLRHYAAVPTTGCCGE